MAAEKKALIGRVRELSELESGIDEAMTGSGGLFLLVGEPGIGKTRLADELGKKAQDRGFTVHWGRCWEAGGAPAFWPWIQIFRSMLRDPRSRPIAGAYGSVLSRLLPELRKEAGTEGAVGELDQAEARFQLFDEVWMLLRAVAEQMPVLVVLDDLHAADPSSLALLQFIVRDMRANRVVALATYRDREAKPTADVSDAIRSVTRDGTFLPLRRLSVDEVSLLLDDRAGRPLTRDLALALHRVTEGNPMFVDQVFRMLETRNALDGPIAALPIPEGVRDVIRRQLSALEPATRTVLDAASVVGRELSRELLAAVSGLDDATVRGAVDDALDRGIFAEPVLGAYEFGHALFREALYRDLPEGERAKLHARAAEALDASRAPDKGLGEIALHLLAAVSVVGASSAAEGAMRAGRRALDALAFEDAVNILTATLDRLGGALDDLRVRARVLVMMAEARVRSGDSAGAETAARAAAAIARTLGDPTLLAEAALAFGVELVPGVIKRGLVLLLEEANRTLPPIASALRARVLARLAAALQPAPNPEEPIAFAREAVAMARTLGDPATLRTCLHMGGSALVDYADPIERCVWDGELLRLSTDAGDEIAALRGHVRLFFDHLELGQVDEADAQLEQHGRLADRLGLVTQQWLTLMMRALRAIWDGRFAEAVDLRDHARRLVQRTMTPEMEMTTHLQGWGLALARGEPLPEMARVVVLSSGFPGGELMGTVVRSFEEMRQGHTETARSVVSQVPADSPFLSCMGPHIRFLAETCARLDDRGRAKLLLPCLGMLEGRMMSCGRVGMFVEGPTGWLMGMLAGVLGQWDDATRYFETALERSVTSRMKPYEAITCLEYARLLAKHGGHDGKRDELLRRGRAIAEELEMTGIVRAFDDVERGRTATGVMEPVRVAAALPPDRAPLPRPGFSLDRDGDMWAVAAGQRTFRLKDSRGMQMLAELSLHPNREFHVLTLMGADMSDTGDAGELIDREATASYRERVDDLRERIEEAESWGDATRAERLRHELEQIAAELARGVGLGGRRRRAGAAVERARINVQRRLREAIRRITEQDAKLGRFLDRSVRTGTFCAYEPE